MSLSSSGLINEATAEALHPVAAASCSVHWLPVNYHIVQVTTSAAKPATTGMVAISRKSWNAEMFWFNIMYSAAAPSLS